MKWPRVLKWNLLSLVLSSLFLFFVWLRGLSHFYPITHNHTLLCFYVLPYDPNCYHLLVKVTKIRKEHQDIISAINKWAVVRGARVCHLLPLICCLIVLKVCRQSRLKTSNLVNLNYSGEVGSGRCCIYNYINIGCVCIYLYT